VQLRQQYNLLSKEYVLRNEEYVELFFCPLCVLFVGA
jgi:hypothetical protein